MPGCDTVTWSCVSASSVFAGYGKPSRASVKSSFSNHALERHDPVVERPGLRRVRVELVDAQGDRARVAHPHLGPHRVGQQVAGDRQLRHAVGGVDRLLERARLLEDEALGVDGPVRERRPPGGHALNSRSTVRVDMRFAGATSRLRRSSQSDAMGPSWSRVRSSSWSVTSTSPAGTSVDAWTRVSCGDAAPTCFTTSTSGRADDPGGGFVTLSAALLRVRGQREHVPVRPPHQLQREHPVRRLVVVVEDRVDHDAHVGRQVVDPGQGALAPGAGEPVRRPDPADRVLDRLRLVLRLLDLGCR